MFAFFHSWRRRVGYATLGVALALLVAWFSGGFGGFKVSFHVENPRFSMSGHGDSVNSFFLNAQGIGFEQIGHYSKFGCYDLLAKLVIPFWLVTLPLSVLSAYLLIVGKRKANFIS